MIKPQQIEEPNGYKSVMAPVISPKLPTAATCAITTCESCLLGRSKKRSAGANKRQPLLDKEGLLSRDKYEVGDFVSTEQFFVRTTGRLSNGYVREQRYNRFHGDTIYNDAASGLICVENQVPLGANETVLGKLIFEEWLWEQASAEISHYHSDNGVFVADKYRADCENKGQTQSFSCVGAQHKNARAERAIQTIMYMARTFIIHSLLHW